MAAFLLLFTLAFGWLLANVLPGLIRMLRCLAIPSLPGDDLLIGHRWILQPEGSTVRGRLKTYRQAKTRVMRFNFSFHMPLFVLLLHPDVIAPAFNTNVEPKTFFPYTSLEPIFGNSLVLAGGARWRRNRNLLKQAFGRKEIKGFFTHFRTLANDLCEYWEAKLKKEGKGDDGERSVIMSFIVDEYFSRLSTEGIMRCAFATVSPDWIEGSLEYEAIVGDFFRLHQERYKNPLYILSEWYYFKVSSQGKKHAKIGKKAVDVAREIVKKRRLVMAKAVESGDQSPSPCMVDIILNARDPRDRRRHV